MSQIKALNNKKGDENGFTKCALRFITFWRKWSQRTVIFYVLIIVVIQTFPKKTFYKKFKIRGCLMIQRYNQSLHTSTSNKWSILFLTTS